MDLEAFRHSSSGRVVKAPAGYHAFVPYPLPPSIDWTPELVMAMSEADRILGELSGLGRSLPSPHLLIMPFVRREAVLSSRIEGTRASLSDLYTYEAIQLSLFEPPSDVREVYNYVRAMEYGLERLHSLPLSLRLIREIHARLMEGVRGGGQTPGEFRRSQNWIGSPGCALNEATFVPPPVPEMHQALSAFEEYLYQPPTLPPLVRLGLIHYQFEAIHPFLDGNGRIGRLLVTLLLCAWDLIPEPLLYLSAYLEDNRQDYYERLLHVSREGAWQAWLLFFLQGVSLQAWDVIARSRKLQDLREQYRAQFQATRAAARLLSAVDLLFARPILTVNQAAEALEVTFATAQRHINHLAAAGLVREITGQARNRVYRADEVLAAIEGPLGRQGEPAPGEAP